MSTDWMGDLPTWVSAGAAVVLSAGSLIGGARYFLVSPLTKRMDVVEEKARERQAEIRTRLTEQDTAIRDVKVTLDAKLGHLDDRIRAHEQDDVERLGDLGERTEGQITALRRDMVSANDTLVTHQRADINSLGVRIDTMVSKVVETLAALANRKSSHSGAD